MFQSIRWRIAIPYTLLTVFIMAGLGFYLSDSVRQSYLEDLEDTLTAEARLVADAFRLYLSDTAATDLDAQAREWAELIGARVTLIGRDGTVVGESHDDRTLMDNHLDRPEVQDALATGIGSSTRFSRTVGYQMMYLAAAVESQGETIGFARVALPLEGVDANVAQLRSTIAVATLFATMLTILLAVWIANQTAKPLLELTAHARTVAGGRFEGHLVPESGDEVGQLAHAFNVMLNQLRAQIGAMEIEQSKLEAVLNQMTDGVMIADEDGQIKLINPAAQKLFNVKEKQALGHSLAEVVRQHQLVELWQRCQESGEEQVLTLEVLHQRKFVQSIVISLEQALPGQYLLLFQDLTRMRRLETVRRDFISNISHELRTPLASLKALTETLRDGAIEDPPAAERFLERMETEVDALAHMVSELLELTRIESGQVPLELKPVSACLLIHSAVERLGVQAERAELTVEVNCSDELPDVWADKPRLGQALVNLLHNAIKFTPAGGKIILAARSEADMIIFSIRDTGVGIPAEDLPRIFERFYKADRARSGGGTGLGLAITRHLVEAHGGRIWAESVEGRGSTFYFSIPVVI